MKLKYSIDVEDRIQCRRIVFFGRDLRSKLITLLPQLTALSRFRGGEVIVDFRLFYPSFAPGFAALHCDGEVDSKTAAGRTIQAGLSSPNRPKLKRTKNQGLSLCGARKMPRAATVRPIFCITMLSGSFAASIHFLTC